MLPAAMIPVFVKLVIDRIADKAGSNKSIVQKLASEWLKDADAVSTLNRDLSAILAETDKNQIELNRIEAQSDRLWKSGWRPAAGWICIIALGWHYLLEPMLVSVLAILGIQLPPLPRADFNDLWTLLFALLGMSGLRSFDKRQTHTKP